MTDEPCEVGIHHCVTYRYQIFSGCYLRPREHPRQRSVAERTLDRDAWIIFAPLPFCPRPELSRCSSPRRVRSFHPPSHQFSPINRDAQRQDVSGSPAWLRVVFDLSNGTRGRQPVGLSATKGTRKMLGKGAGGDRVLALAARGEGRDIWKQPGRCVRRTRGSMRFFVTVGKNTLTFSAAQGSR